MSKPEIKIHHQDLLNHSNLRTTKVKYLPGDYYVYLSQPQAIAAAKYYPHVWSLVEDNKCRKPLEGNSSE